MVKNKVINYLPIILILIIAAILRFYKIGDNLVFHGELGHNYLEIKNFILSKEIPLLGPPTSHPWLSFGPLFYWIFAPVLMISQYQPIGGAVFFALVSIATVYVNYVFVKKHFSLGLAIVSSLLIAISPSWINFARESRFYSLVVPITYLFLELIIKSIKGRSIDHLFTGVIYGVFFSFHFSPVIFFPTVILLYLLKILDPRKIKYFFIGLFIPLLPIIINDAKQGFLMSTNFLKWIPYRIAGFVGIIPKNNFDSTVFSSNLTALSQFVGNQIIAQGVWIFWTILAIFLVYLIYSKKSFLVKLLVIFLAIGYLGIFIHGNPPPHYFLPLFPIIVILLSRALIWAVGKNLSIIFLGLLFFVNINYFVSDKWFNIPDNIVGNVVPYKMQEDIASQIIKDAKGEEFSLKRIGEYDYFDENYSQNYRYLLWLKGNEPVIESNLNYTIIEKRGGGIYFSKEVK